MDTDIWDPVFTYTLKTGSYIHVTLYYKPVNDITHILPL